MAVFACVEISMFCFPSLAAGERGCDGHPEPTRSRRARHPPSPLPCPASLLQHRAFTARAIDTISSPTALEHTVRTACNLGATSRLRAPLLGTPTRAEACPRQRSSPKQRATRPRAEIVGIDCRRPAVVIA
jgi:hypothetical protein